MWDKILGCMSGIKIGNNKSVTIKNFSQMIYWAKCMLKYHGNVWNNLVRILKMTVGINDA